MLDSDLVANEVNGDPALEFCPNPFEMDLTDHAVFGKQRCLLPTVGWVFSRSVFTGGCSCGLFYLQPYIGVFNFLYQ
jgi:hypothetical protein